MREMRKRKEELESKRRKNIVKRKKSKYTVEDRVVVFKKYMFVICVSQLWRQ